MTEQQLEEYCLQRFAENGRNTQHGSDTLPEGVTPLRTGLRDVVLLPHLETASSTPKQQLPRSC